MNILSNAVTGTEMIDDEYDDSDDNCGLPSAALSASMSSLYSASTGCDGTDGYQILREAGNIMHKKQATSDEGPLHFGVWASC